MKMRRLYTDLNRGAAFVKADAAFTVARLMKIAEYSATSEE
jgi:hypothetical protein